VVNWVRHVDSVKAGTILGRLSAQECSLVLNTEGVQLEAHWNASAAAAGVVASVHYREFSDIHYGQMIKGDVPVSPKLCCTDVRHHLMDHVVKNNDNDYTNTRLLRHGRVLTTARSASKIWQSSF